MANYDVSVTMNLVDNVTRKLSKIEDNIDKVVKTAQAYNTVVEKITRSLNQMTISANKAATATNKVATNMAKLTDRMGVKLDDGSARVGKVSTQMETLKNNIGKTTAAQKHLNDAIRSMPGPAILRSYSSSVNNYSSSANRAARETERFNKKLYMNVNASGKARVGMSSLSSSIKSVIGAYVGFESLKTAVDWSDEITLTQGKLAQLTDDVEGFLDKTYQMSQNTRTSYMDNASQMAKMWQLTGGTDGIFDTEDKLIEFNELLNKSFIMGGSGVREINASIYQLTQALSSGRLQGDELRSLAENAPYLIKTITKSVEDMYNAGKPVEEQIKLSYNDLKNLGAQGVLTSEVITNAVLNSADDIRKGYENITPTFEQIFQKLKNQVQYISQPILKSINEVFNSEAFDKTTQTIVKMFTVVMAVINPIIQGVLWIGSIIADNWSLIEPVIWGIVGALTAYYAITSMVKIVTWAHAKILALENGILAAVRTGWLLYRGLQAGTIVVLGMLTGVETAHASALLGVAAAQLGVSQTTLMMLGPFLLVIGIILAIIGVIYLAVAAYNYFTGSNLSATGMIVGAFYGLYAAVYDVFAGIWNILVEVAEFLLNVFNDPVYYAKSLFGGLVNGILKMFKGMAEGINSITRSITNCIENLVNGAIDMINGMIGAYNSTAGALFGKIDTVGKIDLSGTAQIDTSGIDNAIAGIDSWIGTKGTKDISFDKYKAEYKDIGEYYNKGYDKGEGWADALLGRYPNSLDNYVTPDVGGGSGVDPDLMDAINKMKDDTGNIDENTKITAEDLKYLRDLAEQRVINRFTTAEIKITNHMNNNINSDRDLDGIANYLVEEMYKGANAYAEGAHY